MTLTVLPYPLEQHSSMISPFSLMFRKETRKAPPSGRNPTAFTDENPSFWSYYEPKLPHLTWAKTITSAQPPAPYTTTQQIPSRSLESGPTDAHWTQNPHIKLALCPHVPLNQVLSMPPRTCALTFPWIQHPQKLYAPRPGATTYPTQPASSCPPTTEGVSILKPVCKDRQRHCCF